MVSGNDSINKLASAPSFLFSPASTHLGRFQFKHLFAVALLFFIAGPLWAGGPENVVLVVNADSPSSLLLANHYQALRNIPANRVIYLNNIPDREAIKTQQFKDLILTPIIKHIQKRKIGASVDYIIYSSGFPTRVNHLDMRERLVEMAKQQGRNLNANTLKIYGGTSSITAMTYFGKSLLQNDPSFMLLDANWYYRKPTGNTLKTPFVGETQKSFENALTSLNQPAEQDAAIETLKELAEKNPQQIAVLYSLSRAYALKGDKPEAIAALRKAIDAGWSYRLQTQSELAFSSMIGEPQFDQLLKEMPDEDYDYLPTRGFKSNAIWGRNGWTNGAPDQGKSFMLSTMLADTDNKGISEQNALKALRRSCNSDRTRPQGTFYFIDMNAVRSSTRKPGFGVAIRKLAQAGFKAEAIKKYLPEKGSKIAGAVFGKAGMDLSQTGEFLPGAICENLTSYGGVMDHPGHIKCTTFMEFGAAGSSGTVVEPYAIQAKFPHPMIQVHYSRGCTLAEAFYQSVAGPFQLLIVGDALCQPWAQPPEFSVTGIQPKQTLSGVVEVEVALDDDHRARSFELYVDGRLATRLPAAGRMRIDTNTISDGFHEMRLVAVSDDLIGASSSQVFPVFVKNLGHRVDLNVNKPKFGIGEAVELQIVSNFGDRYEIVRNTKVLKSGDGQKASVKIAAKELGRGPVDLSVFVYDSNQPGNRIQSVPVRLEIEGPIATTVPITAKGLIKRLNKK